MTGKAAFTGAVLLTVLSLLPSCGASENSSSGWPGIDDPARVNFSAAYNAVSRFNEYRESVGVQKVDLDYDLSRGCQLHADYLKHNSISLNVVGLDAHTEDSTNPLYSEDGERAAHASIIYEGVAPVDAIDRWMRTFYHRLGLLDPNIHYVGYGSSGSYQVMDVLQGRIRGQYSAEYTVLYPNPGASGIAGNFENEIPWPVPGDSSLGIPITAEFFGPRQHGFDAVEGWLQDLTTQRIVPTHLQYPGQPLLADWDIPGVIALIPADPLEDGHSYRVHLSAVIDRQPWKQSWDFSTR
ncbi:MAG: CAP domain-containing protein [Planctomycetales bacterium]|nr:MAG: CAP domain-containing protein [Planctomycetales bacterium]